MSFLRHYLLAIQFFTRIPVRGRLAEWVGYSHEMLRRSSAHFPGVGVVVGSVAAISFAAVMRALPAQALTPLVAAVVSTIATVMLTGAFHEDGLADVADGLGGSYQRERALEIMKDSRIGAFGAIALVLALLMKVSLLAMVGGMSGWVACALILYAHVLSRCFPLWLIRHLPHMGDLAGSKSKVLADQISAKGLAAGGLWLLLCLAALLAFARYTAKPLEGLLLCGGLGGVVAFAYMWRLSVRRLQGYTGDFLGATQQVCELGIYLGAACCLR